MQTPNNEADRIYRTIFSKNIPPAIRNHFMIVSKKIEPRFTDTEIRRYQVCIKKVHDLEALELAARYFKKLPLLTVKFKVMIYLAETLPENYTLYINEKDNFIIGSILLVFSLVRTSYKLVKGMCLITVCRL